MFDYESFIRATGILLFIYPVKRIYEKYVDLFLNAEWRREVIKYHFPTFYKIYISLQEYINHGDKRSLFIGHLLWEGG